MVKKGNGLVEPLYNTKKINKNVSKTLKEEIRDHYNLARRIFPKTGWNEFFIFDDKGKIKTFVPEWLGKKILKKFEILTTTENDTIFRYNPDEGIWTDDAEPLIKSVAQRLLGEKFTTRRVKEALNWIKGATHFTRDTLGAPKNLIVLKDGVYDLTNKKFLPHSPDYKALNKIPVEYVPEADCPKIQQFLGEIVDEKDILKLVEFIGYCLYRDTPIHRTLLLVGDGANGKSTFIKMVKEFVGKCNVSAVSLQALSNHRFMCAELYGKLANLYFDLPKKALADTGVFKALSTGDPITAEFKHKDPFIFDSYAKLIFSANEIPRSYDKTYAFYRRWLIIEFPNKFEGDDADPYILGKIMTPEEISGLFVKREVKCEFTL